jgi:hypothetical protein
MLAPLNLTSLQLTYDVGLAKKISGKTLLDTLKQMPRLQGLTFRLVGLLPSDAPREQVDKIVLSHLQSWSHIAPSSKTSRPKATGAKFTATDRLSYKTTQIEPRNPCLMLSSLRSFIFWRILSVWSSPKTLGEHRPASRAMYDSSGRLTAGRTFTIITRTSSKYRSG